jgi:predicted ATPase
MRIQHLAVDGFRRLESVANLELRPLTVVLGANGSGKTSLLDAVRLIARSAAGAMKDTLNELGGLPSVLTRGRAPSLQLGVTTSPQPISQGSGLSPLVYSLEIEPQGQGYRLSKEMLSQQINPGAPGRYKHIDALAPRVRYTVPDTAGWVKPNWDYDDTETALSQVPKMYRQCEAFRQRLASLASYAARDLQLGPRSPVRSPQPMRPAGLPGSAGEDLVPCLYYLRETERDRFEMVEDALSAAFPSFERLDFPPVAAGTLAVTWKDREFSQAIYTHELSDGTLRFLWLVTLLSSSALTAITLIDEPEVSLHPGMLRVLSDLFRESAARTQLIVATHSESLVRFLRPSEILALDLEDGHTVARWGDTFDLDPWLKDYAMDELWRMNRFGANP